MENIENLMMINSDDNKLMAHTLINNTENSSVCEIGEIRCQECDAVFEKWFELMQHTSEVHQQIHTNLDDKGIAFATVNEDNSQPINEATVTQETKLRTTWCHICKKHLATVSSRNLHMRIHTGVRPFVCNICGKSFTQNVHLRSHISVHTGAKPHMCKICNKGFVASRTLKIHLLRNHSRDGNSLTCPWCGVKFEDKDQLVAHTLVAHADESPTPPSPNDVDADGSPEGSAECDDSIVVEDDGPVDDDSPLSMVKTPSIDGATSVQSPFDPSTSPASLSNREENVKKRRVLKPENNESKCFKRFAQPQLLASDGANHSNTPSNGNMPEKIYNSVASIVETSNCQLDGSADGTVKPSTVPPFRTATGTSRRKCATVSRCPSSPFASSTCFSPRTVSVPYPPPGTAHIFQNHTAPLTTNQKQVDCSLAGSVDGGISNNSATSATHNMRCRPNITLKARLNQRLNDTNNKGVDLSTNGAGPYANGDSKGISLYSILPGNLVNQHQSSFLNDFVSTSTINNHIASNNQSTSTHNHNNSNGNSAVNVTSPTGNGVGTSVKPCPNCMVVEGELQLMKAEMCMIKQFLSNKLTLMEQKMDNMQALIRQ